MGLFDFLFGSKKTNNAPRMSSRPTPEKAISFRDKFAEIPSLNFFGKFKKSHSNEWAICWSDSDEKNHRASH
jgi:hypothetical protein